MDVKEVYRHTQIGYFLILSYSAVMMIIGILVLVTEFHPIAIIALVVMFIVLALFATLTVTVSDDILQIQFGIEVIQRRFPVSEIVSIQMVRNPWYYGWWIRYTPRGWLFGVSGFWAIELEMESGKRYRIGTNAPVELADALDTALYQLRKNGEIR